jgi:hypothetical protein
MRRVFLVLLALCAVAVFAQEPPAAPAAGAPAPGGGRGRGAAPKNLKIIKPEDLRAYMGAFVAGTGLQCTGCHVQGDFASDDKHEKVVARAMLAMVNDLNAKNFNGEMKVTCFTCHRAESRPRQSPDPK